MMRAQVVRTGASIAGNRLRMLFAVALALFGGGLRGARAQEPPPPTPEQVLPVTTELVRIDVVVTDKGGRPKEGLTRADFVVLEDGVPQPIAQFEAFTSAASTPAAPSAPPVAAPAPARPEAERAEAPPARAPVPSSRYVVLAVDDIHIEVSNLIRVKKTLERFLEREVEEGDQIAVVTTSGTLNQAFTDDRQALRRSLARLSVQTRPAMWVGAPRLTDYQAEQIVLDDPEALRVAVEEILAERRSPNAGQEARTFARMLLAESYKNARITLETLDQVVRGLSELRGRKVLALVSDGFTTGLRTQGTAAFDVRRITDAGTRAGVVIYSLNSRGLVALTTGMTASSRMTMTGGAFGVREQLARAGDQEARAAMGALAADTGGFLVENSNDFGAGLRRILKDTETYYLIAYEPTNTKRDGAFRKIEVRLPGQRDLRIRNRKGYFAPDDSKAASRMARGGPSRSATEPAAPPDGRRVSELNAALNSTDPLTGIPVRLSADFVSADGALPQVVVSGLVDLSGVSFVQAGDRHLATIDAAGAVFDEKGAAVGTLEPESAALDLTTASYERAIESGLEYQKAAPVKPGRYRVRFAARHDGGGVGGASQWVEIPDLADGKLTLSSVFLLKKEATSTETAPAPAGDALALRSAQARRRFKRGETLYVQVFVYNPGRDGAGGANLVTQAEIWREGVRLASTAEEAMAPGDLGSPPTPHTRSIKLDPFGPGEYEVRIVVTDRNANAMASRRVSFAIE